MVMNIGDALGAYKQAGAGKAGMIADAGGSGMSFADELKGFVGDTVDALKEGEKAAAAGAGGKTDLASVVTAINNAEMMLQTVVTIRDKVISAYQSIVQSAI
jgi:flagellar hook-basal body complex protein FliE